ncbi:unnamed protein product, partial [marine sediment metagenome]
PLYRELVYTQLFQNIARLNEYKKESIISAIF